LYRYKHSSKQLRCGTENAEPSKRREYASNDITILLNIDAMDHPHTQIDVTGSE
jgi:hypothetical protein